MPPRRATRATNPQENPENPELQTMAQMMEILRQQSANLAQQQQQFQQQYQQQRPQPQEQAGVTFKAFQAVHPPEFKGTSDPIEARAWLKEMEKAFELTQVEAEKKTIYASYFLKGEANYWWESKKILEGAGVVTWERFTALFLEKYFPKYMQNQMELKFFELKQDNMTVTEYEAKFTELGRFVPEYVDTDEKRAKRFQQGLKPWIRSKIAILELTTYAMVVQKALIAESESDMFQKERDSKKRKPDTQASPQQPNVVQNRFFRRPEVQQNRNMGFRRPENRNVGPVNRPPNINQPGTTRPMIPQCRRCGVRHTGDCKKINATCYRCNQKGHYATECRNIPPKVTCYRCGRMGHIAKDCKVFVNQPVATNVPRIAAPPDNVQPKARTFNMTLKDAVRDTDVVAGTLLVNSLNANVLIDSGATRSFISEDFIHKLRWEVEPLRNALTIEIANKESIVVRQICPRCEIEILGHIFLVDLIPFRLGELI